MYLYNSISIYRHIAMRARKYGYLRVRVRVEPSSVRARKTSHAVGSAADSLADLQSKARPRYHARWYRRELSLLCAPSILCLCARDCGRATPLLLGCARSAMGA